MYYYKFYSYDVWRYDGGWTVNNVFGHDYIVGLDVDRCQSNKELAREIRNALYPEGRTRYHLEGEAEYTIYVERERDGYPLFELRKMDDEEIDRFLSGKAEPWNDMRICMSRETRKKIIRRAKA